MQKKFFLFGASVFLFLGGGVSARSYPLTQVSAPACKYQDRSQHSADCKITLPRIQGGDYISYSNDPLVRSLYTILWGATYPGRRDMGYGSHPGVDIATAAGTPVFAIGDGEVIVSGPRGERGNTVIIKHIVNGEIIYSSYAHLESAIARLGQIKEGTLIGFVGDSGNAFGNHLHFQIDKGNVARPPFFFPGCQGSISDIVNLGLCRQDLIKNTLDPIWFLENQSLNSHPDLIISQYEILSPAEIKTYEIREFLKKYPLIISSGIPNNVFGIQQTSRGFIRFGNGYKGLLPEKLQIVTTTGALSVFPNEFEYIDGTLPLVITPLGIGLSEWNIAIGSELIQQSTLAILTQPQGKIPSQIESRVLGKDRLGNTLFAFQIKDRDGNTMIGEHVGSIEIGLSGNLSLCSQTLYQSSQIRSFLRQSCSLKNSLWIAPEHQIKGRIIGKARGIGVVIITTNSIKESLHIH